jgi:hypothetical protein
MMKGLIVTRSRIKFFDAIKSRKPKIPLLIFDYFVDKLIDAVIFSINVDEVILKLIVGTIVSGNSLFGSQPQVF